MQVTPYRVGLSGVEQCVQWPISPKGLKMSFRGMFLLEDREKPGIQTNPETRKCRITYIYHTLRKKNMEVENRGLENEISLQLS